MLPLLKQAMKPFYFLFIALLFYGASIKSQTVVVSGQCITGSITLDPVGDIDGKPAYEGSGTVDETPGVVAAVYWMPSPDDLWVLAFDGQPYFQTICGDPALPPATGGSCLWTVVSGQTCTGPDLLVINGTGTLPIKLTSFTARKKDKGVILNWQTASEINNKGFEIQKSADGITWTKIGFVNGSINSSVEKNYQFTDAKPLKGKNFYRLLQLDLDNKPSYSFIVSVNITQSGFYSLANNPGNGLYRLHIDAGTERVNFSVFDEGGRKIMSKSNNGVVEQTIDITNFPAGIYLLQIQKGTSLFTEKLIKF